MEAAVSLEEEDMLLQYRVEERHTGTAEPYTLEVLEDILVPFDTVAACSTEKGGNTAEHTWDEEAPHRQATQLQDAMAGVLNVLQKLASQCVGGSVCP